MSLDTYLTAIHALVAEGKNPTIRAIRAHVGKGSFSSILAALDVYKARQNSPVSSEPVGPLPSELSGFVEQIWQRASELAQSRLEAERASLTAARNALEARHAELLATADGLAEEVDTLTDSLAEALRRHEQSEAELLRLQLKLAASEEFCATKLKEFLEQSRRPHTADEVLSTPNFELWPNDAMTADVQPG